VLELNIPQLNLTFFKHKRYCVWGFFN